MNNTLLHDEAISRPTEAPTVEVMAYRLSECLDALLAAGAHPVAVAEASFLAALPLLMEVTRSSSIEGCLAGLATRFDGNTLRSEH